MIKQRTAQRNVFTLLVVILFATSGIFAYLFVQARNRTQNIRELEARLTTCSTQSQSASLNYLLCAKMEVLQVINTLPTSIILSTLYKGFQDKDITSRIYCHDIAHYVGRQLVRKTGDVRTALAQCDSTCNNGCYHGVMEIYFDASPTISPRDLERFCNPFFPHSPAFETQCFHGLGHGLNVSTHGDIPQALKLCGMLFWAEQRESCYYGAVMESLSSTVHADTLRPLDLEKALDTCKHLDDRYQRYCYTVLGSAGLGGKNHDFPWAFARCDHEVSDAYKENCYRAIGFQIGHFRNWDIASSLQTCADAESRQKKGCYEGLIGDFMNNSDLFQPAIHLCWDIEAGYHTTCWGGLINSLLVKIPLYII